MKFLLNFLKKDKPGSIYAFDKGIYAAKMFVLINKDKDKLNFLMLPENLNITLEPSEFLYYKKTKTCKFIEVLPDFVNDVCVAQYLKNIPSVINTNNE